MLREEFGRLSGIVVFVGGQKVVHGKIVAADGVYAERDAALRHNAFLLPIGASGGAAKTIAESLLRTSGQRPRCPTNKELTALLDERKSVSELIRLTIAIVRRVAGI
jgi:hypothetical protein